MSTVRGLVAVLLTCLASSWTAAGQAQAAPVQLEPAPPSQAEQPAMEPAPATPQETEPAAATQQAAEEPAESSEEEQEDAATDDDQDLPEPTDSANSLEPAKVVKLDTHAEQRNLLTLRLSKVNAEIEDTSTLLPWIAIVAGASLLITGAVAGATSSLDCKDSCPIPFWPGWAVTTGATVGIAGFIWLRWKRADMERLGSRRYRLQRDLYRLELDKPEP